MKKILLVLLMLILVVSMSVTGCAQPKEKEAIKISDLNWGSAHFQSELARIIIIHGYGYPVELVPGKTIALFQGLRTGELDVVIEVWLQNQQEAYDKAMAAGDIVDLGILNNDNWQSGFNVPTYVIKGDPERGIEPLAPNLKSVSDLSKPEYKELFQNPENRSKGMIMNGPPGWECEIITVDQVVTYGLDDDYDVVNTGSQEGLFASLLRAYERGEPWLGYLWGPTWIAGKLDLTQLEEPPYDEAVWEENYGCAWPSVDLLIVAHKDFPSKAPEVAEMFKKWEMSTAALAEVLAYMDETSGEPFDAAVWFIKEREEVWTKFVPDDIAQKVKEAIASGLVAPQGAK